MKTAAVRSSGAGSAFGESLGCRGRPISQEKGTENPPASSRGECQLSNSYADPPKFFVSHSTASASMGMVISCVAS
jgi:hypothetical protein